MNARRVNLLDADQDALLIIAERACFTLRKIADHSRMEELRGEETRLEFGRPHADSVEIAYNTMIIEARSALDAIAECSKRRSPSWRPRCQRA